MNLNLEKLGKRPADLSSDVFVHALALVESSNIGKNTRIWPFAHVMKGGRVGEACNVCEQVFIEGGAVIGNHCTIKNGISIWNKVRIEDDVFLGPHMVFTNDLKPRAFIRGELVETVVKKGATIGAGAVIVCGVTLGEYAFVAAGAVVTKDVPAHGFVLGNPAKLKGYVCKCAQQTFKRKQKTYTCNLCK